MSVKQRKFSKEFKLHVVKEVQSGQSQASVARRYEINPKVLNRWMSEFDTYAEQCFAGKGKAYTDEARISLLTRKIEQLEAENSLLKKALTQLNSMRDADKDIGE